MPPSQVISPQVTGDLRVNRLRLNLKVKEKVNRDILNLCDKAGEQNDYITRKDLRKISIRQTEQT